MSHMFVTFMSHTHTCRSKSIDIAAKNKAVKELHNNLRLNVPLLGEVREGTLTYNCSLTWNVFS